MKEKAFTRTILIKLDANGGVNISPLTDVSDKADSAIFSSVQTRHYEGFPENMPGNIRAFLAIADFLNVKVEGIRVNAEHIEGGPLN